MLKQLVPRFRFTYKQISRKASGISSGDVGNSHDDDELLQLKFGLTGVHLDDLDAIMSDEPLESIGTYFPNIDIDTTQTRRPFDGHNVVVIQPWTTYANFDEMTNPELQLQECVSLGNTLKNWKVVGDKIVFAHTVKRKLLVGPHSFLDLKESIFSYQGVSAVFFGIELLSGIQLVSLEKELRMPVFDRFTIVLNIFRQHAQTKEAKLQLALAELPYIRSHLRSIHESTEDLSSTGFLKNLVGGAGDRYYHQRINILKSRERKLKKLLDEVQKQRSITSKNRRDAPIVSVIGYTNSGKTTIVKYLSQDERLIPMNQLFATLDVTGHFGQLPSTREVMYLDTIGFVSRIPNLLVDAFSTTLKDILKSDLLVHVLDVTHPDIILQHSTVMKALEQLRVPKRLMDTMLTIGNKVDLTLKKEAHERNKAHLPKCDLHISATSAINMTDFVEKIDHQLKSNLGHEYLSLRVENGGREYSWLRKNSTIVDCKPDEEDGNYLICRVIMSPAARGRWSKHFAAKSGSPGADKMKI